MVLIYDFNSIYHLLERNERQPNDDHPNRFSDHHLPKVLGSSSFSEKSHNKTLIDWCNKA